MLHHFYAKSLDDIYLEDLPHIIHPTSAAIYLEDTAKQNRIVEEWNLPRDYMRFVRHYSQFHYQQRWMAYKDTLNDVKAGNVILLRKDMTGHNVAGVVTASGHIRNDIPPFLYARLSRITALKLKRPVSYVRSSAPVQHAQATKTINSKAAGALLAAGGVYNGNIEGFRKTAEQLGGDAVEGYDDVLNEKTSGAMVAAASVLMARRPLSANELTSYLGKYKKAHVLLDDVNVSKINYVRRDRAEYAALRSEFNSSVRPKFLKSLSDHPDALSTFDSNDLQRLARGNVPPGWQVHHKIPLDDGGTNELDNLVLIQNSPYHSALTKSQANITRGVPYNSGSEVLWPSPKGVIYPVKK